MRKIITIISIISCLFTVNAQSIKVKKGEILLDKQAVAKIEKQKKGYKISSLDGSTWFIAYATNVTQTKQINPNYWLELTGPNGNIRETEYSSIPFTMSKEKWHIDALLHTDTALLTTTGIDPEIVNQYFQSQDRSVSDKFDRILDEQRSENENEDKLANEDKLVISGSSIKIEGETVGIIERNEINRGGMISYNYVFANANRKKIASISFYTEENLNTNRLILNLTTGEEVKLNQVKYSFSKISLDDLTKRAVHKLHSMGYFKLLEK